MGCGCSSGHELTPEELQMALQRDPSSSIKWELDVHLRKGRNLAKKDLFSESDPYCVISVNNEKLTAHQSRTFQNDACPVWNETFQFWMGSSIHHKRLEIACYDDDVIGNSTIGRFAIDLVKVAEMQGQTLVGWISLHETITESLAAHDETKPQQKQDTSTCQKDTKSANSADETTEINNAETNKLETIANVVNNPPSPGNGNTGELFVQITLRQHVLAEALHNIDIDDHTLFYAGVIEGIKCASRQLPYDESCYQAPLGDAKTIESTLQGEGAQLSHQDLKEAAAEEQHFSLAHPTEPIKGFIELIDYAPRLFATIRSDSATVYEESWNYQVEDLPKPEPGAGRSGSLFLLSKDERYIFKSLPTHEFESLKLHLADYAHHFQQNPGSKIMRIVALHKFHNHKENNFFHLMVCENLLYVPASPTICVDDSGKKLEANTQDLNPSHNVIEATDPTENSESNPIETETAQVEGLDESIDEDVATEIKEPAKEKNQSDEQLDDQLTKVEEQQKEQHHDVEKDIDTESKHDTNQSVIDHDDLIVQERYDLKGRKAKHHPTPPPLGETWKDHHLPDNRKFCLSKRQHKLIRDTIHNDVKFLQEHNMMDYSLLVGVVWVDGIDHTTFPQYDGVHSSLNEQDDQTKDETVDNNASQADAQDGEKKETNAEAAVGDTADSDSQVNAEDEKDAKLIEKANLSDVKIDIEQKQVLSPERLERVQQVIDEQHMSVGHGELYSFGIIDFLSLYELKKKTAHFFKTFLWEPEKLSTIPSPDYAKRFLDYLDTILIECDCDKYNDWPEERAKLFSSVDRTDADHVIVPV